MKCSVFNCTNDTRRTSKGSGITFHLFPKDSYARSMWVEALGLCDWEPTDRSIVCSDHFHSYDTYVKKSGQRVIKYGALPIPVHDPANDMDTPAAMSVSMNGTKLLNPSGDTPLPTVFKAKLFGVCRICLSTNTKLYSLTDHLLDRMYEEMMHLQVLDESSLPQKLCWECAHRLSKYTQFKNKAVKSQQLLLGMINSSSYITIGQIKRITQDECHHKTKLVTQFYDPNDYDFYINDEGVIFKNEEKCEEYNDMDVKEDIPEISETYLFDDRKENDLEIEVKNEDLNNSGIFFQEFDGHFDDDDDIMLSEVASERGVKEKCKVKKVKKKKMKEVKKVKAVKKSEVVDEEANPSSTMDKYKKSDVRRRKTQDALDESLFTISPITYEEQIAEVELRQQNTSYISAPYKCTTCYRGFLNKDRYDAHLVRHSVASGEYECFICKTRLKNARALRKHLTSQHTEKYSCKGCPFVTKNRGVAREHEKWHAGTKYQCPHCPSEFDKLTTYMGHLRIKHATDFVCDLCGYTFISEKGIEVHKKKKHKLIDKNAPMEGPYCEVCNVKFISEEAHSRHLKLSSRHSNENDPDRIRNDSQSMNSEKNGRIVRRIERRPVIHPRQRTDRPNVGPITCEQCGIQLRDLRLYAQHFRRSHPDKNRTKYPAMKTPCMCEQCGKIFQSMALLKDHMWVHTGEKRFKCDKCDKSFTQKTNLVFHLRAHTNSRPSFECPLCGKHFAFFNNRRRHMFIHTGLKPFKCETCGKCFTTAGEQRAHVDHVHLKKPWPKRSRTRHGWRDERED